MKKLLMFIGTMFICTIAIAHTIEWYVDNTLYQTTTCNSGDNITPPTAPVKYGYTFDRWNLFFTRLEYIESTGTQYINTGFIPTLNTKLSMEISLSNQQLNNAVVGDDWQKQSFLLILMGNYLRWHLCEGDGIDSARIQPGTKLNILAENGSLKVNNEIYTAPSLETYNRNLPLRLFYQQRYYSSVKIYSFKIYENNTLVRNFIPTKNESGVVCMYDTVTHTFFENAGTGEFVAGPEVGDL